MLAHEMPVCVKEFKAGLTRRYPAADCRLTFPIVFAAMLRSEYPTLCASKCVASFRIFTMSRGTRRKRLCEVCRAEAAGFPVLNSSAAPGQSDGSRERKGGSLQTLATR